MASRKPPGNRVQRTPEVQRERDRKIPRPPADSGLAVVSSDDWRKIWQDVRAKPPVKVVGYQLLKYADFFDGADIRPGEERLALETDQTTRTVSKALAQMREWGLLWRYRQGSKHGRSGLSDEYRLTVPADLVTRVPLVVKVAAIPEHPNEVPVIPERGEHGNEVPVIEGDRANEVPVIEDEHPNEVPVVGAEHRNLMHRTPESDDTEHPNDVRPTSSGNHFNTSSGTSTSSSTGFLTPLADVEGHQAGAGAEDSRSDTGERRCRYAQCRTPSSSVEPGQDYHPACKHFAKVKTLRTQTAAAVPASPYPDDHRDKLPEDYEDGDHAA